VDQKPKSFHEVLVKPGLLKERALDEVFYKGVAMFLDLFPYLVTLFRIVNQTGDYSHDNYPNEHSRQKRTDKKCVIHHYHLAILRIAPRAQESMRAL
jgi:hypothetical protein